MAISKGQMRQKLPTGSVRHRSETQLTAAAPGIWRSLSIVGAKKGPNVLLCVPNMAEHLAVHSREGVHASRHY
jgi:hypothetical protein